MNSFFKIALVLALVSSVGCSKKKEEAAIPPPPPPQSSAPQVVQDVPKEDLAMDTAIKESRSTVDEFIKALQGEVQGTSGHSVKALVKDGEKVEHFWLVDVKFDGQKFSGKIDNTPQSVKTVSEGQAYEVAKGEISDWMYVKDGVAVGNRTLKAMFPRMKPEEVVEVKKSLGW